MESAFEIHGYFEEIWDARPGVIKIFGTRAVTEQPSRKIGPGGEEFFTITKPLTIDRGHKKMTLHASAANPVKLMSRYLPLCGRLKSAK